MVMVKRLLKARPARVRHHEPDSKQTGRFLATDHYHLAAASMQKAYQLLSAYRSYDPDAARKARA